MERKPERPPLAMTRAFSDCYQESNAAVRRRYFPDRTFLWSGQHVEGSDDAQEISFLEGTDSERRAAESLIATASRLEQAHVSPERNG